MLAYGGLIHLFYSAGWYNTADYQVGHAICGSLAVRTNHD